MSTSALTLAPVEALCEEDVAQLWQACPWGATLISTTAGERIQVVYPGRRNLGPGPDFLDAIIALDGRRLRYGHIEVHSDRLCLAQRTVTRPIRPTINVMLHVVWEDDGPIARRTTAHAGAVAVLS